MNERPYQNKKIIALFKLKFSNPHIFTPLRIHSLKYESSKHQVQ